VYGFRSGMIITPHSDLKNYQTAHNSHAKKEQPNDWNSWSLYFYKLNHLNSGGLSHD
jgi:alpha-galactosidase